MIEGLNGKVCIVTGAARGLGAEMVLRLGKAGARVVAADLSSCAETISSVDADILEVNGDVSTRDGARRIVEAGVEAFGRVDVLINNAAFYGGMKLRHFSEISEDEWDLAMRVNVKGVWQMCRAVTPVMERQREGKIVNIASNVIFMGKVGFLHYVASKGAVWAMTNALSKEVAGTGITVNGIAPGYVATEATRSLADEARVKEDERAILSAQSIKRILDPEDVAGTALFLASDLAGMMTGQTLIVDGGVVVR